MTQAPSPAERLERLEYKSSEEKRRRKLFQIELTHPAVLNSSPDQEGKDIQFFAQQLNMPRFEIDVGMHVAKLPQSKTVLVKLSDHKIKILLFQAKNNAPQ